jgi:hypothetical protein
MKSSVAGARRPLLVAVLVMGLANLVAGCANDVTYTYVDVHVTIDEQSIPATQLFHVTSCEFHVEGADMSSPANIRCPENMVSYDVGTFQWTSEATSGTLNFIVQIFDPNLVVIGEGTSSVPVSPGKHLQTAITVVAVPQANAAQN